MKKILTILLVLNFTSCNKKDYLLDIAKGMNKEDAIKTWDKIYDNFCRSYARIAATYKYNPGKRCYYPTGKLECSYRWCK